jgi:hypothetical protein
MNAAICPPNTRSIDQFHARFLALLPRIELHARITFRGLKCPDTREDAVAETVALAWKWHVRLAERGKDVMQFSAALAILAARAVRSGRRLCGHQKARDVLSPVARRRHGFRVEPLPTSTQSSHDSLHSLPHAQQAQDAFEERLRDNTLTPVPEQAAFRIDFPAWLKTLMGRERRIIRAMARNERTRDLSRQFEVSPGRISQLRREFHDAWCRFHGEEVSSPEPAATR